MMPDRTLVDGLAFPEGLCWHKGELSSSDFGAFWWRPLAVASSHSRFLTTESRVAVCSPIREEFVQVPDGGEILATIPPSGRWSVTCARGRSLRMRDVS